MLQFNNVTYILQKKTESEQLAVMLLLLLVTNSKANKFFVMYVHKVAKSA